MELFGFQIKRKGKEAKESTSFAPPSNDDGSIIVSEGGVFGTYVDINGSIRSETELITKYRNMSLDPIVDMAVQDIVNEAIVEDSDQNTVSLELDEIEDKVMSKAIKEKVLEEFKNVLNLLEFSKMSYETFKRWYVDGRLFYHVIVEESVNKTSQGTNGIKELRYIDPRHIKKVKVIKKVPIQPNSKVEVEKLVDEYFLYNKGGFIEKSNNTDTSNTNGLKISKDAVVVVTSGYLNAEGTMILSYLNKIIRPLNQLRSMEDSLVIYRISRAPERRVFYIDVGGLPTLKAEQYLRNLMTKFKNKVVYDSSTGEIRDDRKHMSMLEDFWLPRRESGKGTEITTLPGGQNLGQIDDVVYFQNQLYRALNVPITRLQSENAYTLGRGTEITRDEVKFAKFITRLRSKFSELFTRILEKQLIMKKICTPEDFEEWKNLLNYRYAVDNYYAEIKNIEMTKDRIDLVTQFAPYVGRYYSNEYIRKFILQQTDEEMKDIDSQIKKEKTIEQYIPPIDPQAGVYSQPEEEPEVEDSKQPEEEEEPPPKSVPAPKAPNVTVNVHNGGKKK